MKRYWFKAKRYGYGWYPATWEGWAVVALWAIAFFRLLSELINRLRVSGSPWEFAWYLPLFVLITGALIWVSWAKGEPARWRWGDDN